MKFKIIFLFFPLFIVGQSTSNEIEIIRDIDSYVKYVDSISFSLNEEMSYDVILPAHGSINGKPIEKIETEKKVLKIEKQILKMIYSEKKSKLKEEFVFYYKDLKLVYVEFLIYKKKKSTKKVFYYNYEMPLYPSFSDSSYGINVDLRLIEKSRLAM
ncbi:hypothetical protein [Flavobacterium cheniae]|uniref:Uncharacterized protein n=1 Tax=Flavobacterium cheniae TaxID=295428 RepID=A0A562KDU6_9FLAO|nr:hypothetical protein [Flavobacterium cheniae]TDR19690.1 hypothetical protein C8D80_2371 [Flavobacterium cheniae]TWH93504.1 hypothetical protein IP97_02020 [Flavobacterium cheniae]